MRRRNLSQNNKNRINQTFSHHLMTEDESPHQRQTENQKKYDQQYQKLAMMDPQNYKYSNDTFMPYLFFFKYLAKRTFEENTSKCKLKLWIPDTIILNDRDLTAMWFYSSADGYIYRTDTFTGRNAITKFKEFSKDPNEVVAVIKKPHYRNMELIGNDTKPILESEMSLLFSTVMSVKGETTCLQQFIKCNGPKAYICRTIWKRKSNSVAWIITNKIGFQEQGDFASRCLAIASKKYSCNIIPCTGGRFITETMPHMQNLLKFLRNTYQVEFDELGADFIKGVDDKWYLLNVRGFKLSTCIASIYTKNITHDESIGTVCEKMDYLRYVKSRICKFCQIQYPAKEMTHELTLKMLIELDQHLLQRNIYLQWIVDRVQLVHIDIAMLFHKHFVCDSCYLLYKECNKLNDLLYQTALQLGIDVQQKNNIISLTQQDYRQKGRNMSKYTQSSEQYDLIVQQGQELDTSSEGELVIEKHQNLQKLQRFRILIHIKSISQIPGDFYLTNSKYYIYYEFLNQQIKFRINLNKTIDHCKLFYVFAEDRNDLTEILSNFSVQLIRDNEFLGEFQCELDDFLNDQIYIKDYLKYFSGPQIKQLLSWATELSIGVDESINLKNSFEQIQQIKTKSTDTKCSQENIAKINSLFLPQLWRMQGTSKRFRSKTEGTEYYEQNLHKPIYLPNQDYYCCEPLNTEWMNTFKQKPNKNQLASFAISDVSNILDNSRIKQTFPKQKNLLYSEICEYEKETSKILDLI